MTISKAIILFLLITQTGFGFVDLFPPTPQNDISFPSDISNKELFSASALVIETPDDKYICFGIPLKNYYLFNEACIGGDLESANAVVKASTKAYVMLRPNGIAYSNYGVFQVEEIGNLSYDRGPITNISYAKLNVEVPIFKSNFRINYFAELQPTRFKRRYEFSYIDRYENFAIKESSCPLKRVESSSDDIYDSNCNAKEYNLGSALIPLFLKDELAGMIDARQVLTRSKTMLARPFNDDEESLVTDDFTWGYEIFKIPQEQKLLPLYIQNLCEDNNLEMSFKIGHFPFPIKMNIPPGRIAFIGQIDSEKGFKFKATNSKLNWYDENTSDGYIHMTKDRFQTDRIIYTSLDCK